MVVGVVPPPVATEAGWGEGVGFGSGCPGVEGGRRLVGSMGRSDGSTLPRGERMGVLVVGGICSDENSAALVTIDGADTCAMIW